VEPVGMNFMFIEEFPGITQAAFDLFGSSPDLGSP
jgi:hypothetical protein